MTIEQQVLEKLRELPPEKLREVLEFLESIMEKNGAGKPRRTLLGLWSDLNIRLTEDHIREARHEMWGTFPRNLAP